VPRADFRIKDDALDPQAPVKLLAVMCHPADPRGRERLLRQPRVTITVSRHQQPPWPRGEVWSREQWAEFQVRRRTGYLAGALALSLAQVSALGRSGERAAVLSLAVSLSSAWEQAIGLEAAILPPVRLPPRRTTEIVAAFSAYRSVSHLWAALVYGNLQKRPDIQPTSSETLPAFLAYADEIARLAVSLPWLVPDPALDFAGEPLWTFVLPAALKMRAEVGIFQMPAEHPPVPEVPYRDERIEDGL
jgi:hypothetical protein